MSHALIFNGIVINAPIVCPDPARVKLRAGEQIVAIPNGLAVTAGWSYGGGQFVEPPQRDTSKADAARTLAATDAEAGWRLAEALVGALTAKGVVALSDLPQPARDLLAKRQQLRDATR